ncbi:hypothetical protein TNCV_822661 [Trichonephila clavipes]|nr:hypothetical protein TNCV_822661 [Trichonephila clavipes]
MIVRKESRISPVRWGRQTSLGLKKRCLRRKGHSSQAGFSKGGPAFTICGIEENKPGKLVPYLQAEQYKTRRDQSGPEETSQGDQVPTTLALPYFSY